MWSCSYHASWAGEFQVLELILSYDSVADRAQVQGRCNVWIIILGSDAVRVLKVACICWAHYTGGKARSRLRGGVHAAVCTGHLRDLGDCGLP